MCVFENIMPKKIFRYKSRHEKEDENYKMRSLKKNEISEACDMRVQKKFQEEM